MIDRHGLDACVHCGFCLQSCPTYLALEDENDSPRGRLVLMRALADGEVPASDPVVGAHLDRCLGCRACETACPSGVPYGALLEETRSMQAASRPRPWIVRVVLAVFRSPGMLRLALWGARLARATGMAALLARLPGRLGFPFAMLASTARGPRRDWTPRPAADRGPAVMLEGCVMAGLFADANRATARVLAHHGWQATNAPGQGCCGALHAHAGDLEGARALARANIAAFERSGTAVIAVNSAGCGAMMKEYRHLLRDDPAWAPRAAAVAARVRDISELVAGVGVRPAPGPAAGAIPRTVTYDAPCHLQHAQRITAPPLQVLGADPALRLVPLPDSDQCCGSAGIYNLVEPAVSDAVLAPKLAQIRATGAPVVATGNPGCLMQIGAGLLRAGIPAVARHPVELLDEAYARDRG